MYLCARKYKLSINMSKTTMGNKLPRKLEQKMQTVGEQIKLARLRRNLSVVQVAERATCSPLTVSRIEKGTPTVAIGIYLRVLYALQLDDDILLLAMRTSTGLTNQCWLVNLAMNPFVAQTPIRSSMITTGSVSMAASI